MATSAATPPRARLAEALALLDRRVLRPRPACNVDDLRRLARRRLPRTVFDFIEGGAGDERTVAANRADLDALRLWPRAMVDVSRIDTGVTLFGRRLSLPLVFAPTGLTGIAYPKGELPAAAAAAGAGIGYCLSINASSSLEEVAQACRGEPFWFQAYLLKDRALLDSLIERARAAGCDALTVTVDLATQGRRERDVRNGFTVPPKATLADLARLLLHPRWLLTLARGPAPSFPNFDTGRSAFDLARFISEQFDAGATWADIERIKRRWNGPLVIKGVMHPQDARDALAAGADAVIVSNHGGRQLDGAPSSIAALPGVVAAVGDRIPVLMDGGVRRATDLVRARALGATACLWGRPVLYSLGALGVDGPAALIAMLRAELQTVMTLLGVARFDEIDERVIVRA